MEKQRNKRTLKEIFEFTEDAITEPFEVVRTIGFTLQSKGGARHFRLEAVKHLGKKNSSVIVWKEEESSMQRSSIRYRTLDRIHPDLALKAMVGFIRQHYTDFSKIPQ
jgi:hypothetical protein